MKNITIRLWHFRDSRYWRVESSRSGQLGLSDRKFGLRLETLVIAVILAVAILHGGLTYGNSLATAAFYQTSFGPALNFACNGEYRGVQPTPEVLSFLERRSQTIASCRAVESNGGLASGFEASMIYLELASAAVWRVFGIDWGNLLIIASALTAGFAVASYFLFRVFSESRLLCGVAVLFTLWAGPVLSQLPHLRDFSKAPFLIGALACLGFAILRSRQIHAALAFAMGAGALISIGMGFRPDLRAMLPIAALSPLLLLGSDDFRRVLIRIATIWIAFSAGYFVFLGPLALATRSTELQSATFLPHIFILGFAEDFQRTTLGMLDAHYSVLRRSLDEHVFSAINLFGGTRHEIGWGTLEYDRLGGDLLKSIMLLVPYDTFMRVPYAANSIGNLTLNSAVWGMPLLLMLPILLARLRDSIFVTLVFGILTATLTLQYSERHAFYMVLFGPILILLFGSAALQLTRHFNVARISLSQAIARQALFVLAPAALLVMLVAFGTWRLADYQRQRLSDLASIYANTTWRAVPHRFVKDDRSEASAVNSEGDTWKAVLDQPKGDHINSAGRTVALARLVFRLDEDTATSEAQPIELSWQAPQERMDFKGAGFSFATRKWGYALVSTPISVADRARRSRLVFSGETLKGGLSIGVLNHDGSKFLSYDHLPSGKWQYKKNIALDSRDISLVIANDSKNHTAVRIDSVKLAPSPKKECSTDGISVDYKLRNGETLNFEGFALPDDGGVMTYYFPLTLNSSLSFTDLRLGTLPPNCILDWSIAEDLPPGTPPAELLLVNGKLTTFYRGSWGEVWRNFIN
jgi:hypothetical protein